MNTSVFELESKEVPSNVEKNVTSIKRENFTLIWSIQQFNEFMNRKYEFSSPMFLSKPSGTSKWKLAVFPENVYPDGIQVALRLSNMSTDEKCYSVLYSISVTNIDGKNRQLLTREKIFRNYLDYDECFLASNKKIKDCCLLQSNGTLTISCKIDLLMAENPDDNVPESLHLSESNNLLSTNDLSCLKRNEKPTDCEKNIRSLSAKSEFSNENLFQKSSESEKLISGESEANIFRTAARKINSSHDIGRFENYTPVKTLSDENTEKTSSSAKKIDNSTYKATEIAKKNPDKNLKDLEILSGDLNFLYITKYQHDLTIHTWDGQIHAHKAILIARSDYFRKTLNQSQNDIHIEEINATTLSSVLYYLYTGKTQQMTFDHAVEILSACNIFHLDHLREIAQNSLKCQINISNVTDLFYISKKMKLDNLKISVLKFVAQNHEVVAKSRKWNQMMSDDPQTAGEILLTIASYQKKSNICS